MLAMTELYHSGDAENPILTLGAFALIFDGESKILLCHRTDIDMWNLPGGRVELGEAPWDAVIREVEEETGLQVCIDKLVGIYWVLHKQDFVFTFRCYVAGGKLQATTEADQLGWFALSELPENTLPRHTQRIRDAYSRGGSVSLAIQGPTPTAMGG